MARFEITRTSHYGDEPPCEEAVPAHFPHWQIRTLPSPEAFDAKFGLSEGPWLSKGTDHRTVTLGDDREAIARRWPNRPGWAVDLDSLDDLVAFCVKHGEVVVSTGYAELGETPKIEIYDDYRE
jgi:hypothetical protein